jgi:hypothetical protein
MLRKLLRYCRIHENKIFFHEKINLKLFEICFFYFQKNLETFRRKPGILIPDQYLIV